MNNQNLHNKVLEVTKNIEKQVDAAIEHIDNLDINDLEQLRKQRMQELKTQETKQRQWLDCGHGSYDQMSEEKMFFDVIKKSDNVVIHFFTPTNTRSPILDKHLKILAPKHLETKFVSFNAEKCPFLAERLNIKTIPTLVCIRNNIMVDKVVGFTTLGNCDDFSTEMLEWRLAQRNIISYDGDVLIPPIEQDKKEKKPINKSIREGVYNNGSDDDLEIEDHSRFFNEKIDIFSTISAIDKKYDPTYLSPEEELELGICDEEKTKNSSS